MRLINSLNKTRYNIIDAFFMDDYKWEFLADKYRIIADEEEWADLEADFMSEEDTRVLYGDVNGHSCLELLQNEYNYKEIERLLKYRNVTLYTNEDKNFHILVQRDY